MKKNYFGKAMAVVVMLLAGLSFTSCDEKDNPLIINGKEWVKAEVIKTDDGATIVANTPTDVNRLLMKIANEINDAVQNGEDYVITIEAPSLESSESDNTISLPLYDYLSTDPTNEAKVVVNFANTVSTSDEPLKIQAKGATGPAVAAENKVELNIPAGTSGVDLELNMPATTVTLNAEAGAVTIDVLTAVTAINTLVIENGVTVNWLKVKDGRALVKEGGKVLGYLRDGDESENNLYDARVNEYGVEPLFTYGPDVYYMKDNQEEPYYTQKLKIIKGEAKSALIGVNNAKAENPLETLIIDDGAAATLSFWADCKGIKLIQGLGDKTAKIYGGLGFSFDKNNEITYFSSIDLSTVNEINNVTVDVSLLPDAFGPNDNSFEMKSLGDIVPSNSYITLGPSSTDCEFISLEQINGSVKDGVMSKVTNCTLTTPYKKNGGGGAISHVEAVNSKLTGTYMNYISGNSENSTFTCNMIDFNNDRYSGNTATVKNCKFDSSTENSSPVRVGVPFQTESRSSFSMNFENCSFPKSFMFRTWVDANKPVYDDKGVETGTEPAYYKDYQIKMVFTGSTIDGKTITKDNFVIGIISDGKDENNEVATTTRIIIDDVSYKANKDPDTQKWFLTAE